MKDLGEKEPQPFSTANRGFPIKTEQRMKRPFKVSLVAATYLVLVLYVAAMGPDRIQRLPHWTLWVGLCLFLGTVIATGIVLRGGKVGTSMQSGSEEQSPMTKPITIFTIGMVFIGWVCGIAVAVIYAIVGRIPWSVPIICAPIFAFMMYGLLKTLPNVKSQGPK